MSTGLLLFSIGTEHRSFNAQNGTQYDLRIEPAGTVNVDLIGAE
jgi:hypothetical protein